ncbi:hypothetical protein MMC10_006571 [Thelotrema lepadinum]|nr:hypothetical protein [Thelotrema lepadinum]
MHFFTSAAATFLMSVTLVSAASQVVLVKSLPPRAPASATTTSDALKPEASLTPMVFHAAPLIQDLSNAGPWNMENFRDFAPIARDVANGIPSF